MPARTHGVKVVFLVLCLGLFVLQSGCSTSGGGDTEAPPSNANALHLTLSSPSGSTAVVANGRDTIPLRMQVTNASGAGVSGLPVTFATPAGTLSPSPVVGASRDLLSADPTDQPNQPATTRADSTGSVTVNTDAIGIAQVFLTAGTIAATAVVTADVQGFRANIVITFVPDVPALVQLTASPTTVSPAGTATLTATVTDVNGNHVSAGETVTFSLSTNTSGATLSAVSGVTNSSGQATVKYTAGGMPGADTVQAQVTSTVVGFASITVTESQNLSHVTSITAVASAPNVVADGKSTVAIRATVTTASGFSPAGLVVTFTATVGRLSSTTARTDANGVAIVNLIATTSLGTATVTAAIGGFSANTDPVMFVAGPPAVVLLSAFPATVNVRGMAAEITATVLDANGNPVNGQTLTFAQPTLGILDITIGTTNTNGQLIVHYTGTTPGTDTVQARTVNGIVGTVNITVSRVTSITVVADSPRVEVGKSVAIRATVTTAAGFSPAGLLVTFTVTTIPPMVGTLSSSTATTDINGVATVNLFATSQGTATVTAAAGDLQAIVIVTFFVGPPALVTLSANPSTVTVGGTSIIQAVVTDAMGNPTAEQTLVFALTTNATGAKLDPLTGNTDKNGLVIVTYTAGTAPGRDTVQARTVNGITGTVNITVIGAGPPALITLSATPSTVTVGGTSIIQATVTDAMGHPTAEQTLVFALTTNATGAKLDPLTGNTDKNGLVIVTYTAGTTPGRDTVQARTVNGITGTVNITVTRAGPPALITLIATPSTVTVGGLSTIQATVTDAAKNPTAGQTVVFTFITNASGASFMGGPATGTATCPVTSPSTSGVTSTNGLVAVTYKAGMTPGTDAVQACVTTNGITATPSPVFITVTAMSPMTAKASPRGTTGSASTATETLSVSLGNFAITTPAPPTEVPLNTPQTVTVHWDKAGVNQVGQMINFFATRGDFAATPVCPATLTTISTTTDGKGNATVYICADNAGPAVISAAANVSHGPSSQVEIEFVATTVNSLVLQATPTTLGVNPPGSTTQQSVITAVVRDAQGNLVKNQTVSFSLHDVSGGHIFLASDVTDSVGQASTVYTVGAAPSAHDGVVITAAIGAVTATVTLTVAQRPLFVVLGTGDVVNTPTSTQYALPYSVLVTDADGNPVAGASVDLSVLPTHYQKGFYDKVSDVNHNCGWQKILTSPACENEDRNQNGLLDPGEDFNNNGRVDPGNVATASPSTVTTDTSGFAFFNVVYAKQYTWVEVALEARTVVAGTEGSSQAQFFLLGAASDFNDCTVPLPGQISPFGIAVTCADPL